MFKKNKRLDSTLFDKVFSEGFSKRNKSFLLKGLKNNVGYPRFAVTVSKKQVKSAVKRHLLKRRFISALKDVGNGLDSCDYVFVLNSSLQDVEYKDLINIIKENI